MLQRDAAWPICVVEIHIHPNAQQLIDTKSNKFQYQITPKRAISIQCPYGTPPPMQAHRYSHIAAPTLPNVGDFPRQNEPLCEHMLRL